MIVCIPLLTACQLLQGREARIPEEEILFTQNPCSPPCWYGITPGETTRKEAFDILHELPFVDTIDIDTAGNIGWQQIGASSDEGIGGIMFSGELVESINLRRFITPLTVQQVIEFAGPPEATESTYLFPGDNRIEVHMVWLQQGLLVDVEPIRDDQALGRGSLVVPESEISIVIFQLPVDDLSDLYPEARLPFFHEWNGLENIPFPQ
jgi:hypothetical protein